MKKNDPVEDVLYSSLAERMQAGEEKALGELCAHARNLIWNVAFAVLHHADDAEEMVTKVLLEIWHTVHRFDPARGRFKAWIHTLVLRRSIDALRTRQAFERAKERFVAEEAVREILIRGSRFSNADIDQADADQYAWARELLRKTKMLKTQRAYLELTFMKGMSQREVAAHLGIPLGTTKTRIAGGLKKMRERAKEDEDLAFA